MSDPESPEEVEESQSSRRVLFSGLPPFSRQSEAQTTTQETDIRSDEERVAMAVQMRTECCINASFLDLDRVLRELQDKVADANEFTRIGPFGVLPVVSKPSPSLSPGPLPEIESVQAVQDVEQTGRISTPDLNLSLSQFAWGELDDVQAWDALDSALVTFSRFNSEKGSVNGDLSATWDLGINSPLNSFADDTANTLTVGRYGSNQVGESQTFDAGIGTFIQNF